MGHSVWSVNHFLLHYFQKSARYFLDKLDQLSTPDYVPGDSDLLHCYVPTLGLFECNVHHDNITFRERRPKCGFRSLSDI